MNGGGGRFRVNHQRSGGGGGQRKERDNDDLLLFKELNKREKDQAASLLQPFSDEFEVNAAGTHHSFYRIPSGKKDGSQGYEFFGGGNGGKSDYDWLKTPPATPLFPSLEMEANRPDLLVQREITVVQPRSRFAAIPESSKARSPTTSSTTTSPPANSSSSSSSRPKIPTTRSSLPNGHRPAHNIPTAVSSATVKNTAKAAAITPAPRPPNGSVTTTTSSMGQYSPAKPTTKDHHHHHPKTPSLGKSSNITNGYKVVQQPKSRGLSPTVRSNIAVVAAAVATSADRAAGAISSARVDRASSTSRVRSKQTPLNNHQRHSTVATATTATAPATVKPRSSSSSSRPRLSTTTTTATTASEGNYVHNQRGKFVGGSGPQVFGSKMVDKVMSARKSSTATTLGVGQHQETVHGTNGAKAKAKANGEGHGNGGDKAAAGSPTGGSSGFGRILALRNMESNRDRNSGSQYNHSAIRS